jgi:hypothetical protein
MIIQNHFIVTGRRPTGEMLFLCDDASQGARMIPGAQSRAARFESRKMASAAAYDVAKKFKGLHVAIEPLLSSLD